LNLLHQYLLVFAYTSNKKVQTIGMHPSLFFDYYAGGNSGQKRCSCRPFLEPFPTLLMPKRWELR
jgi:hypothetical protein